MNDTDLAEQIKHGNKNAFRFLMEKNQNLVWGLIYRMVKVREDAEDLYQEVFIRVYKDIKYYKGNAKLSTWIGSIAFNVSTDYLRKKGRTKNREAEDEKVLLKLESEVRDPHNILERNHMKKQMQQLINKLPEKYLSVITLYHLKEFSYLEISEITEMPVGTVKSYINRGRALLKKMIEKNSPELIA